MERDDGDKMNTLYLSRRNLLVLLNKLDRKGSNQTIIKNDTEHPKYPASDRTIVVAIEDADYYTDREPGGVHPEDVP
jgi:hypothetical protein